MRNQQESVLPSKLFRPWEVVRSVEFVATLVFECVAEGKSFTWKSPSRTEHSSLNVFLKINCELAKWPSMIPAGFYVGKKTIQLALVRRSLERRPLTLKFLLNQNKFVRKNSFMPDYKSLRLALVFVLRCSSALWRYGIELFTYLPSWRLQSWKAVFALGVVAFFQN
jgi:hypothetical protein